MSTNDQLLLEQAIARLKATGVIEYTGEFGAEITTFIPFVFWLKSEGLIEGRRLVTYAGMRPYYYVLEDHEFQEKPGPRDWLPIDRRDWPTNSTYTATRQPWHVMPDYRTRYQDHGRLFERPVLFVQNKFTVEWEQGPINYLPLKLLERLFRQASERFDIVYSRPRPLKGDNSLAADVPNAYCDYPDFVLARRFDRVLVLEDLCEQAGAPYNLTKLEILAKAYSFVAVQGGGAHLLACFNNALMLLLHYRGEEHPHAYKAGAYKYLSKPAPILMIAQDYGRLQRGIDVICETPMRGPVKRPSQAAAATLDELRV